MTRLCFVIPGTIDKRLSPNWRGHWGDRSAARKRARRDARLVARSAHIDAGYPAFDGTRPVLVEYTVYLPKGARRMDQDNLSACFKGHTDGISDALTEGEDGSYETTVRQEKDAGGGGFIQVVVVQE